MSKSIRLYWFASTKAIFKVQVNVLKIKTEKYFTIEFILLALVKICKNAHKSM